MNSWREQVRQFKRSLLLKTLQKEGGNRTRAAHRLGLQRTYLVRLIRTLGAGGTIKEADNA